MLIKKISDVMTRDMVTVTSACSLEEALALMAEHRISTLAVVEDGRPVGLATEEELLSFAAGGTRPKDTSIARAGIAIKLALKPDVNTLDAAASMEKANARAAVVTDDSGKLLGIVTITDILHRLGDEDFVSIRRAKHSISMPGEKVFVSRQESVGGCIGKMVKEGIDCVVVTSHSKPVGIFTRRDAVRLLSKSLSEKKNGDRTSPTREPVSACMTEPVLTVDEERPLSEVTDIMEKKGIRRMVVVDDNGRLKGLITQKDVLKRVDANYSQIIQRVAAETRYQLNMSEAKYDNMVESSIESIYIIRDGKLTYMNPSMVKLIGSGIDRAEDKEFLDFVHPDDRGRVKDEIEKKLKNGGNAEPFRYRVIAGGGKELVLESVCQLIKEKDGEALMGFARDVTEQTARRRELERENRVMGLLNEIPAIFADGRKKPDQRLKEACVLILKYREAECCAFAITTDPDMENGEIVAGAQKNGDKITTCNPKAALPYKDNAALLSALNDKTARTIRLDEIGCGKELASRMKDAAACTLVTVPMLVNDAPVGLLGLGFSDRSHNPTDIDIQHYTNIANQIGVAYEHCRLSLRLRNSEALYKELFDSSVDIVIMTDKNGIMEDINAQFTVSTGYDPRDWIGKPFKSILAKQDQPGAEILDRCEERFAGAEFVLRTHFGDKYFYISSWPRYNEEGEIAGNWRVARDVTESKFNEKELVRAKQVAEDASMSKTRFLANVSHELRTPLTAIIGFSNLISGNDKIAEEIRDQGRIVSRQGKYLLKLINNMLDIVQLEKGGKKLELQEVGVREIIDAAVEKERENAETKQLAFKIEIDPALPKTIMIDEHKLSLILDQLVNNAVKFSNNGTVQITASMEVSQLVFQIKDDGIGIDEKQLIKIFDRFHQADASSTRKYSGAGLGLPLARAALAEIGGTIWVKSTPGNGSTFFFSVPLAAAKTDSTPSGETRQRVLVAEKDETAAPMIRDTLGKAGFDTVFAANGDEAVNLSGRERFDVILFNIDKTAKNACEAVKRIKENAGYRDVPAIALTVKTATDDDKKLLAAAFDCHIEKPFRPLDLLHKIESALPEKQHQHS